MVREKGNTKNLCWMSAKPRGQLQERLEQTPGLSPQPQGMGEVLGGPSPDRGWTGGLSFETRSGVSSSPCNCQGAWKGSKEAWAGQGGAKEVARAGRRRRKEAARAALVSRPPGVLECRRGEAGTPSPNPGGDPVGGAWGRLGVPRAGHLQLLTWAGHWATARFGDCFHPLLPGSRFLVPSWGDSFQAAAFEPGEVGGDKAQGPGGAPGAERFLGVQSDF